jgi:hypothetical protein
MWYASELCKMVNVVRSSSAPKQISLMPTWITLTIQ